MNNKRHIRQKNFRDNYNGYQVYDSGIYLTQVNTQFTCLELWSDLLTYYIR